MLYVHPRAASCTCGIKGRYSTVEYGVQEYSCSTPFLESLIDSLVTFSVCVHICVYVQKEKIDSRCMSVCLYVYTGPGIYLLVWTVSYIPSLHNQQRPTQSEKKKIEVEQLKNRKIEK